jgi:hypothetical protein
MGSEKVRIFISYAREDIAAARAIYDALRKNSNLQVFFDVVSLKGGDAWEKVIEQHIRDSEFVLLLISRHSQNKRGYYQAEIRLALAEMRRIPEGRGYLVPILLDDTEPHFEDLRALHHIRYFSNSKETHRQIIDTIESRKEKARGGGSLVMNDSPAPQDSDYVHPEFVDGLRVERRTGEIALGRDWGFCSLTMNGHFLLRSSPEPRKAVVGNLLEIPADNPFPAGIGGSDLEVGKLLELSIGLAEKLSKWQGKSLRVRAASISKGAMEVLMQKWGGEALEIGEVGTLETSTAAEVDAWKGTSMRLLGVKLLSPGAAHQLSAWPGRELAIEGLGELSPGDASNLAKWNGRKLALPGLACLAPESAATLAGWRGEVLDLSSVGEISELALERLTSWPGDTLILLESRWLNPKKAAIVASWAGRQLEISPKGKMNSRLARAICQWRGQRLRMDYSWRSKGANFYLNQWGERDSSHLYFDRYEGTNTTTKSFGIIPVAREHLTRRFSTPSQTSQKGSQVAVQRVQVSAGLIASPIYQESLRRSRISLLVVVTSALTIIVSTVLVTQSAIFSRLLSLVGAGEEIVSADLFSLDQMFRFLRLVARVILAVLAPALALIVYGFLAIAHDNQNFSRFSRTDAAILEDRHEKRLITAGWLLLLPFSIYQLLIFFPGILDFRFDLTIDRLHWTEEPAGPIQGFILGLTGPIGIILDSIRPNIPSDSAALWFYLGYFPGVFCGLVAIALIPRRALSALLGEDGLQALDLDLQHRSHFPRVEEYFDLFALAWIAFSIVGIFVVGS